MVNPPEVSNPTDPKGHRMPFDLGARLLRTKRFDLAWDLEMPVRMKGLFWHSLEIRRYFLRRERPQWASLIR